MYKKGFKNEIIRNGDKFAISAFGFQTFHGNSVIKFQTKSKIFDFISFLGEIRLLNMVNKENTAKTQLTINEYEEKIENIRNSKLNKSETKKNNIKKEIIENKMKTLNNVLTKINNQDINEIINDSEKIKELIDLNNIEDEIRESKFLKRGLFKNEKVQREKKLLYEFVKELSTDGWKKMFENEKRIVILLDNAKIHVAKLTKTISKVFNIKLVFLEKYSSDLNPIERVWYSIKDKLSVIYIEDEIFLTI